MPNTDHRLGYAPAMREDFQAPEWWERRHRYPLGWPRREMEAAANECSVPRGTPRLTPASGRCMTKGDVQALTTAMAQEGPSPARGEPNEPEVMVAAQGVYAPGSLQPLVRTLSPAAEWPFADQGWRNGDGGLGEQQERVRLEKLKAAEHQRWLAQQWAQPMYANEKGKP